MQVGLDNKMNDKDHDLDEEAEQLQAQREFEDALCRKWLIDRNFCSEVFYFLIAIILKSLLFLFL